MPLGCLLPVAVRRLHAVGWSEGPIALVTPLNASRVTVGFKKATFSAPILPM